MSYDYLFKLIIVGDSGVGKSCILHRFEKENFNEVNHVTLGTEFVRKVININNKKIMVQVWDTAGQDYNFYTVPSAMFRSICGIIFTYDSTNWNTFMNINNWINKVNEYSKHDWEKMILGNKIDLINKTMVKKEQVELFANNNDFWFFECSAKKNININSSINRLLEKIYIKLEQGLIKADIEGSQGIKINKNREIKIDIDDHNHGEKNTCC